MGRMFRNEGMDIKHNPEYTGIEFYAAYQDYNDMMNLSENMIRTVAMNCLGTAKINYQGLDIDLESAWRRVPMIDAIKEVTGVDFNEINTDEEAIAIAKENTDLLEKTNGALAELEKEGKIAEVSGKYIRAE